ncbi:(S)-coclaurine N-methyltransferase [Linum perenne]
MEGLIQIPYNASVKLMLGSMERNILPDIVVRSLTRLLLGVRLRWGYKSCAELQLSQLLNFVHSLKDMPIAIQTEKPKEQHYEVPTSFFKLVLGKNLKYRDRQLQNVEIIVADISTFEMDASFDRIYSIEMFEHMKNYRDLLNKISRWMNQDGRLFVHHFCHRVFPYHFEDKYEEDWLARYFFSGGTMPSTNLLLYFQDDVSVVNQWHVNGNHYAQTSEEWLKRMDKNMGIIKPIMASTYGKDEALKWTVYWRTFFMAVAELFRYNNGEEWLVTHYLFKKK